jgi:hypothetical protein
MHGTLEMTSLPTHNNRTNHVQAKVRIEPIDGWLKIPI